MLKVLKNLKEKNAFRPIADEAAKQRPEPEEKEDENDGTVNTLSV
jgi:hypothetical protein